MNKELGTVALALITILAIFAAVQPLLPSDSERFSELGILGPNQAMGGYPTILKVGQQFLLYGYIGNHEGVVDYYQVIVKLGNQHTAISNITYAKHAPVLASYYHVLGNNQSWIFPMNLSIARNGTSLRLIFELWSYSTTTSDFTYTGLWSQIWVNVITTATNP